jgi:hypothetical protein
MHSRIQELEEAVGQADVRLLRADRALGDAEVCPGCARQVLPWQSAAPKSERQSLHAPFMHCYTQSFVSFPFRYLLPVRVSPVFIRVEAAL